MRLIVEAHQGMTALMHTVASQEKHTNAVAIKKIDLVGADTTESDPRAHHRPSRYCKWDLFTGLTV